MRNWKLLPTLIGLLIIVGFILYIIFSFVFVDFFVDLWWYQSLKLEEYFWLRLLYRFFLSGGVTLFFFTVFFFHFWIASRYLGLNPPEDIWLNSKKRQRFQVFADFFVNGSIKFYTPLSLILAIVIAIPFYQQWELALLCFFGDSAAVVEPVYHHDIGFYLFDYPLLALIQKELLVTSTLLFLMVGCLYWFEHTFVPYQNKEYPLGAKIHLAIILSFVMLFVAFGFGLERFSLLYVDHHQPVFYGPGFIELRYELPLIWLAIISFLMLVITATIFIFSSKHRARTPLFISSLLFLAVIGLKHVEFLPNLMDKFIVRPNPVQTERQFMQYNINATQEAYRLKSIKTVNLSINVDASKDIENWSSQFHFENIPVWDREHLTEGYRQLQGIRPYYNFPHVDEDRYRLHGHLQQVNLAAREMNISQLPIEAQNWENKHLRYTHGYGAVITPAAQDAAKPITWYLRDLNLSSNEGFKIKHPDIYFGQENYPYAITPNKLTVQGLSDSDLNENGHYEGQDGVAIDSYFRKALFAAYFNEYRIFFSGNIAKDSKLLIRRNIVDRVKTITPFLHLDKDPYLVVSQQNFYWIQDAYVLSNNYPVSTPIEADFLDGHYRFNYIRNSVKIVINAYDGSVNYYIVEPTDPLIQAYTRAYPSLFKPLAKMPTFLQSHLRYPRDLYYLQMKVYAKYHQNTPELFYEQAETWQFATVADKSVMPYFITMDFGHCNNQEEFVMINPMTPVKRDNLSMVGIAGTLDKTQCHLSYNPEITVFKFAKEVQVNGPAQVDALIDQNTEISQQFTLWNQSGSEIRRGRMVILPMGNSVLYVQPVYMVASQSKTKIPELARVIVSIGNQVVMDKTLRSAFDRLKNLFIQTAKESKGTGTSTESL